MDEVHFSPLLDEDDAAWWLRFQAGLLQLAENATGQLAAWPVEDFLGRRHFVPCARRGTHQRLTDCWSCWSDVRLGHLAESAALRHTEG